MPIHPTAIVDPQARIADTAEIGPYSIIGADVEIGARTQLMAHVFVEGPTSIGEDNVFYPYSSIGVAPQDLKYKGEPAETRIGNRNNAFANSSPFIAAPKAADCVTASATTICSWPMRMSRTTCGSASHTVLGNGSHVRRTRRRWATGR